MNTTERATRGGPPSWQSITSTILDGLDASDDLDVVKSLVGPATERATPPHAAGAAAAFRALRKPGFLVLLSPVAEARA
jgi:hypothetical protein